MVTIEQAKKYPLVKASALAGTKVWAKGTRDGYIYRLSNVLLTYKKEETIGVITTAFEIPDGNNIGLVQLLKPVTKLLTKYTHVLVLLNDVTVLGEVPQGGSLYYSTGNSVNIRKTASATGVLLPAKLNKGDAIGYSDGTLINNYLKFNLKLGGVGYVSKTYCTLQTPIKASVTTPVPKNDPMTGVIKTVNVPLIDNPESVFDWKKTALGAAISAIVVYAATKILSKIGQ